MIYSPVWKWIIFIFEKKMLLFLIFIKK
jgi:hypothetical protein